MDQIKATIGFKSGKGLLFFTTIEQLAQLEQDVAQTQEGTPNDWVAASKYSDDPTLLGTKFLLSRVELVAVLPEKGDIALPFKGQPLALG